MRYDEGSDDNNGFDSYAAERMNLMPIPVATLITQRSLTDHQPILNSAEDNGGYTELVATFSYDIVGQSTTVPRLWEAVKTTWRQPEKYDRGSILAEHVRHIHSNVFRTEIGLASKIWLEPEAPPVDHSMIQHGATLEVDGVPVPAVSIEGDPFVFAAACDLPSGGVTTIVVPRSCMPYVNVALITRRAGGRAA